MGPHIVLVRFLCYTLYMESEKSFNEKLFCLKQNLWFIPSWYEDTVRYYINQYGVEKFIKDRKTKKLREVWAGAIFMLGYQKCFSTQQYIRPSFEEVPDIVSGEYITHPTLKDSENFALLNIEVTEWHESSKENLVERIFNKLHNKSYPDDFLLLVHITKVGDLNINNMDEVFEPLRNKKLKIRSVWVLVGGSTFESTDNYIIFCLYPNVIRFEFSSSLLIDEDRKRFPQILQIGLKRRLSNEEYKLLKIELPKL